MTREEKAVKRGRVGAAICAAAVGRLDECSLLNNSENLSSFPLFCELWITIAEGPSLIIPFQVALAGSRRENQAENVLALPRIKLV